MVNKSKIALNLVKHRFMLTYFWGVLNMEKWNRNHIGLNVLENEIANKVKYLILHF